MVNVGITGASGLIGNWLINSLNDIDGWSIRAISRHPPRNQASRPHGVDWRIGDLLSPSDCADFVRDLDVVVHLAGSSSPLLAERSLTGDLSQNLLLTAHLLQAIREEQRRPHVVFASSGGQVYGISPDRRPWQESDECRPVSLYGVQKLVGEHYLRVLAHEQAARCTVLRIANVYGAPVPPEKMQGVIGAAVHRLLQDQPVRVIGDPANVRDYVHLDDVCRLLRQVIATEPASSYEVFNCGSGVGVSVRDILERLARILGSPVRIDSNSPDPPAIPLYSWNVLAVEKARRCFGWATETPLDKGLARMLEPFSA